MIVLIARPSLPKRLSNFALDGTDELSVAGLERLEGMLFAAALKALAQCDGV